MRLFGLWLLLHLFFAFSFVGTLILFDWNGRAASATRDWSQRALLFGIIHTAGRTVGVGSLVLLGLFGNLLAPQLAYRMSVDRWLQAVNALWIVAVLVMLLVVLPGARRLVALARAAASGETAPGWDLALARWRLGNFALSLLYLALLGLMVFQWHS